MVQLTALLLLGLAACAPVGPGPAPSDDTGLDVVEPPTYVVDLRGFTSVEQDAAVWTPDEILVALAHTTGGYQARWDPETRCPELSPGLVMVYLDWLPPETLPLRVEADVVPRCGSGCTSLETWSEGSSFTPSATAASAGSGELETLLVTEELPIGYLQVDARDAVVCQLRLY